VEELSSADLLPFANVKYLVSEQNIWLCIHCLDLQREREPMSIENILAHVSAKYVTTLCPPIVIANVSTFYHVDMGFHDLRLTMIMSGSSPLLRLMVHFKYRLSV
jgi:hypothetical protein